jgi:hypothetical protein
VNQKPKSVKDWFSFENRCLVCGAKNWVNDGLKTLHLQAHVEDGTLVKEDGAYRQVKPHPVGFPGILLPEWMNYPKCSTKPVRLVLDFSNL